MTSTVRQLAGLVLAAVTLAGCASNQPRNDPGFLNERFADKGAVRQDCPEGITTDAPRNACTRTLMAYVDHGYARYKTRLLGQGRSWRSAFDWLDLSLTTAATVVSGPRSKTNLSTSSTFLENAEAVLGKNATGGSVGILVRQMDSDRETMRRGIEESLGKPYAEYPMASALADVQRYYHLGSVDGAVGRLAEASALGTVVQKTLQADTPAEAAQKLQALIQ